MGMPRIRSRRKKVCYFSQNKVLPDFKDFETIRRFVNERGKILPRRLTGVSPANQRRLAVAVKRARHLALLPFVAHNMK
jgi:small subunit ribosomal protein S18